MLKRRFAVVYFPGIAILAPERSDESISLPAYQ